VQRTLARALLVQLLLFGIVGCVGFLVDASVLYALVNLLGWGALESRGLSYLAAATMTWLLNRRLTFADSFSDARGREWTKFVMLNMLGGFANYSVYAAYIKLHGTSSHALLTGVAAGSLIGMVVNFVVSRRYVFNVSR
jgi:putative flippase GtrA